MTFDEDASIGPEPILFSRNFGGLSNPGGTQDPHVSSQLDAGFTNCCLGSSQSKPASLHLRASCKAIMAGHFSTLSSMQEIASATSAAGHSR